MSISMLSFSTVGIVFTSLAGALLLGVILFMIIIPFKAWCTAIFSKSYIPSYKLLSARARKLDVIMLVDSYIQARHSKLGFSFEELENYHLSGGHCKDLISALYTAKNAKLPLNVETAKAIDLAGMNLVEIVGTALNAKNISIDNISGVTQDNFEIIVSVKASIKTNLRNLLRGGDEDALKDKITSFVISRIAISGNYKNLLSYPQKLLADFKKANLDTENIYHLIDLEISKVDVGRDVGAEMAVKRVEKERAFMQMAAEREKNEENIRVIQMKTHVEEMKSEVLSAEAEVPKAIADAIKEGRFSVMDYYKLMNLQADTALRRSILSQEKAKKPKED